MKSQNWLFKLLSKYARSTYLELRYPTNFVYLLVAYFILVFTNLIAFSNAEQHVEEQSQFNVEAFDRQMLLEADEISFSNCPVPESTSADNNTSLIEKLSEPAREIVECDMIASGNVIIRYDIYTLWAERIEFNRRDSIVVAESNVRIVDRTGNVTVADRIEISEDFKNGIFHALSIETIQRILIQSNIAERRSGRTTTLKDGIYSPYLNQADERAPLWRIRAAEIILDHQEDTISFKDSQLEVFGIPLHPFPLSFSVKDPLETRYSGFLGPTLISDTKLGYGVSIPYFINVRPNFDCTITPAPLSNQGILVGGECRHRLENGTYVIRGSGLRQLNPKNFLSDKGEYNVGNRQYRGAANIYGNFGINRFWSWGWDLNTYSDLRYVPDYGATTLAGFGSQQNVRLNGYSGRNSFEANFYRFEAFEDYDWDAQDNPRFKQPLVLPLIDYQRFLKNSVLGGELSFGTNVISVTRAESESEPDKVKENQGIKGGISRTTAYLNWRRNTFHPLGHVFTPFLNLQGDFYVLRELDLKVNQLTKDNLVVRGMPTVGFEYRFPLIDSYFWGNQIIEPTIQLVARSNEKRIGELPNEDAQSLVFDASTLFETNKFSGFDRTEGGIRANLGIKHLLQFNNGGSISSLVGQSINLSNFNSFEKNSDDPNISNIAENSGLDSKISDYVGSVYLDSNIGFRIGTNTRLDHNDFKINRLEVESAGLLGPISASINYAFLKKIRNKKLEKIRKR